MSTSNLILRTVYLSPTVDDKLRDQAYVERTSKNDLIRRYIEAGMRSLGVAPTSHSTAAAKKAGGDLSAAKAAAAPRKAAAKKATVRRRAAGKTARAARA